MAYSGSSTHAHWNPALRPNTLNDVIKRDSFAGETQYSRDTRDSGSLPKSLDESRQTQLKDVSPMSAISSSEKQSISASYPTPQDESFGRYESIADTESVQTSKQTISGSVSVINVAVPKEDPARLELHVNGGQGKPADAKHDDLDSPQDFSGPVQADSAVPSKGVDINGLAPSPSWGDTGAGFAFEEDEDDFPSYDTAFVKPVKQPIEVPSTFAPVKEEFQLGSTNPVNLGIDWGKSGGDLFEDEVFGTISPSGDWNEVAPETVPEGAASTTKDLDWGEVGNEELDDPVFRPGSTQNGLKREASEPDSAAIGKNTGNIDWGSSGNSPFDEFATETPHDTQVVGEPETAFESQAPKESSEMIWGNTNDHDFDFGQLAASGVTANEDMGDVNTSSKPEKAKPADDLSAMWEAALDDDLLPDSEEVGGFPGFEDDGEGFLEDTPAQVSIQQPDQSYTPPTGTRSASSSNPYAPPEAAQMVSATSASNPYHPPNPFAGNLQPQQQQSMRSTSQPASYFTPVQQSQRPGPPNPSQSFADRSKGGYSSPYDLPEDLVAKPRKRASHQALSSATQAFQPPPPQRLSSLQNTPPIGPPRATPPPSNPSYADKPYSSPMQVPNGAFAAQTPVAEQKPLQQKVSHDFFADLPVVPKQRASGRYNPQSGTMAPANQAPPILSRVPPAAAPPQIHAASRAQVPLATQLLPPERLAPYADEPQENSRPATLPPPSTQYSPAPVAGLLPKQAPFPGPAPSASSGSRYSPAPPVKPPAAPAQIRHTSDSALPRVQAQPYAPRTSSPLAYHGPPQPARAASSESEHVPSAPYKQDPSFARISSMTSQQSPLEPVAEDEVAAPGHSVYERSLATARGITPPPPRSGQSSMTSSPRKRSSYVPSTAQADQGFAPPRRSQTSSPGASLGRAAHTGIGTINRPASAHGAVSPTKLPAVPVMLPTFTSLPPRANFVQEANIIPPNDERANDPLQRWRGAPVFAWSSNGTAVTAFPTYMPRYAANQGAPLMQPLGGQFKVRNLSDVLPVPEKISKFPGPLKKGKKKELLAWLKDGIQKLESGAYDSSQSAALQMIGPIRFEERKLLWNVLALLVEHDGAMEGTPAVEEAVKKLVSPSITSETGLVGTAGALLPDAPTPTELGVLRSHLYKGDREKAVWHAVDQRLWGPALLIASTLEKDIWKQVVQEFVRKEVRDKALAALFQVFAGNMEESIDELVSMSARAGFQMINTGASGPQQDALAGLEKWRETLLLVLNNRSPGDAQALAAIGRVLASYGRFEAAHICFIFAGSSAFFGGLDDPRSNFTLLGGDLPSLGADFGGDLDSILLSEVYEYALSVAPTPVSPIPHLQAYKLYHAEVLAESGLHSEAQQYCDAINSTIHSKTKTSPYFNIFLMQSVDTLSKRLAESPIDSSSSWKPSMDKVSTSLWGKFSSFVAGDEAETPQTTSGPGSDSGQFQRLAGETPPMSATASTADLYNAYQSSAAPVQAPVNSRYAPNSAYTARRTSDQAPKSRYDPGAHSSNNASPLRQSLDSARSSYEPLAAMEDTSLSSSPKRMTSFHGYTPTNGQYHGSPNGAASLSPPNSSERRSHSTIASYQPTPSSSEGYAQFGGPLKSQPVDAQPNQSTLGYQTPEVSHTEPTAVPQLQQVHSYGFPSVDQSSTTGDQHQPKSSGYDPPTSSYEAPTSSYEPPTYQPYQPETSFDDNAPSDKENDGDAKSKKKSFMDDDDDDDLVARAAALKKTGKSQADKEADEAFRKAAEADAARPQVQSKGSWLGSWWGGKKDGNLDGAPGAKKAVKANLGEKSQFVFDPELKKWVNKAAGAAATPTPTATPPPPMAKSTPAPPSTSPSLSSPVVPPAPPPSAAGGGPAPPMSRSASMPQPPPGAASGGLPSRPPSRPLTSMSNASDIDDLLGAPAPRSRTGGAKAKKKGRYVDVMAQGK